MIVPEGSTAGPNLGTGFTTVDAQPEPAHLVAAMESTARWPAVRELRSWERQHLALEPGERLLDVGCGPGDVALNLAADVSPGGTVVGIDASDAMLEAARQRASEAGVDVGFRRGDALALGEPDASFDACRAERTLQWVDNVEQALAELVRVLRPGGRVSVIDTDWRTLMVDLPDTEATGAVLGAILALRGDQVAVGGRLLNLCRDAGLTNIDGACATHAWTSWDPDVEPALPGLFPFPRHGRKPGGQRCHRGGDGSAVRHPGSRRRPPRPLLHVPHHGRGDGPPPLATSTPRLPRPSAGLFNQVAQTEPD